MSVWRCTRLLKKSGQQVFVRCHPGELHTSGLIKGDQQNTRTNEGERSTKRPVGSDGFDALAWTSFFAAGVHLGSAIQTPRDDKKRRSIVDCIVSSQPCILNIVPSTKSSCTTGVGVTDQKGPHDASPQQGNQNSFARTSGDCAHKCVTWSMDSNATTVTNAGLSTATTVECTSALPTSTASTQTNDLLEPSDVKDSLRITVTDFESSLYNMIGLDMRKYGLHTEAAEHFRMAALNGYSKAEYNLGLCYAKGLGVSRNMDEAERLWILAAKKKHGLASYQLSSLYLHKSQTAWSDNDQKMLRATALEYMNQAAVCGVSEALQYLALVGKTERGLSSSLSSAAQKFV